MQIKNYCISLLVLCLLLSCKKDDEQIEINPLNRFSYQGQVYQTPQMGVVSTGEVSDGTFEFELILLSENLRFTKVNESQYNITGSEGPIINFKIHTTEQNFIPVGKYSFSEEQNNRLFRASAVLKYTPPGSFENFILLKDGQIEISETGENIEVNYAFFNSTSSMLTGYFITDINSWRSH